MIATVPKKRVDGGSSFSSLFNYMRYEVDDATAEVFDRGLLLTENILSDDTAVKEMIIVAAMNYRASDPVYHYILSWSPEEKPSLKEVQASLQKTLRALGLSEHQACAIGHDDTAAYHVHVMVNRIHPETYKAHAPEWSHRELDKACRELEKQYGWREAHGLYRWDERLGGAVRTEKALLDQWREEREGKGATATGRAAKIEHYSDRESLESYCKGEPARALRALVKAPGPTWQSLHGLLATHDLRLHASEKGGFTVSNGDGSVHVKASKVFRDVFSGKPMQAWREAVLGDYQPAGVGVAEHAPEKTYRPERAAQRDPVTREVRKQERRAARGALLSAYQTAKQEFEAAKAPDLAALRDELQTQRKLIHAERQQARARVKGSGLDPVLRQLSYGLIAATYLERAEQLKLQLAEARKTAKFVTREAWIAEKAEQGHDAAISYLRGLHYAEQRKKKQALAPEDESENAIGPAVAGHYDPRAIAHLKLSWRFDLASACVVYQLGGVTAFTDRGPRIQFAQGGMNDEGILAALRIAQWKFGRELAVTGSPEFKQYVAVLAHQNKLRVVFTDPGMQAILLHGEARPVVPTAAKIEAVPESSRRPAAKPANEERGQYYGRIFDRDAEYLYQDLGRGDTVKHRITALQAHLPDVGKIREVKYKAGAVSIGLEGDKERGRGR